MDLGITIGNTGVFLANLYPNSSKPICVPQVWVVQEPPHYAKMAYQCGKKVWTPGCHAKKVFQYGSGVQTPSSQVKMEYQSLSFPISISSLINISCLVTVSFSSGPCSPSL